MKVLLIVLTVAIVGFCVTVLMFYVGVILGSAGVMAILEDTIEKELISDIEFYEEKIEGYNPFNTNTDRLFEKNVNLLMEDDFLLKTLIRIIQRSAFKR